jgi:phenylacetate-CoA ligase
MIGRAFMFQQWARVGYKEESRRVIMRAQPIKNNRLFLKFRFSNDWLLSSYHLHESYINQYVDFLNQIKPEYFHVHPSTFYIFTQLFLDSKLALDFAPKAILCGSEHVYDYQRYLFEKTYNTRVYSWLGLAEGTTLAGECEYSSSLHVWPQHSYVELLDENGMTIDRKGSAGSIIGTTLRGFETPFIRYKSGDLATFGSSQCELCGRDHLVLESIDGREQSVIIKADGGTVSAHSIPYLIVHKSNVFQRIKGIQIIQEKKGEIILKLSTKGEFGCEDETEIGNIISSACLNQLSVRFEYTDDFTSAKSGKHIFFIQKIKN